MSATTETNIVQAIALALNAGLKIPTGCIFITPDKIPPHQTWAGDPIFLVMPGATNPYSGEGFQSGGGFVRSQTFRLVQYSRFNKDVLGNAAEALTETSLGILDLTESVVQLFLQTYLPVNGVNLLVERMWYEGTSEPHWADEEMGWIEREINYNCTYGQDIPDSLTYPLP
jgi:hypothetical protein